MTTPRLYAIGDIHGHLPRNVGKLCAVELGLAEPRFTFEEAA